MVELVRQAAVLRQERTGVRKCRRAGQVGSRTKDHSEESRCEA